MLFFINRFSHSDLYQLSAYCSFEIDNFHSYMTFFKLVLFPDDRKKVTEPRLLLARSVISETRASKRARSSSEPFTAANIDDDHRSRSA